MFLDHDLHLLSTSTSGTDAADLMCEPEASTGATCVPQLRQFRLIVFPESMETREVGVRLWENCGRHRESRGSSAHAAQIMAAACRKFPECLMK